MGKRGKNHKDSLDTSQKNSLDGSDNPAAKKPAIDTNESMLAMLAETRTKNERTIDDVFMLLATFIESRIERDKKDEEFSKKLEKIEHAVIQHEAQIADTNNGMIQYGRELTAMQSVIQANETILHRNEQKIIDNDVFLSLFPYKPNADEVGAKLAILANLPADSIRECYVIPMRSRPQANSTRTLSSAIRQSYAVVVSLREKQQKQQLMLARRSLGQLKIIQLSNIPPGTNPDITINCSNRLSVYNLNVLRTLNMAKTRGIVNDLQFHNGLFRYKFQSSDRWMIAGSSVVMSDINVMTNNMSYENQPT